MYSTDCINIVSLLKYSYQYSKNSEVSKTGLKHIYTTMVCVYSIFTSDETNSNYLRDFDKFEKKIFFIQINFDVFTANLLIYSIVSSRLK